MQTQAQTATAPTGNQLATITKLCGLLNIPTPPAPLTGEQASDQITALCARYNAERHGIRRPQPRPDRRLFDRLMESDWVEYMERRA